MPDAVTSVMPGFLKNPGLRIYLMWTVLYGGGFIATAFNTDAGKVNLIWLAITAAGLAYMAYEMPLQYRRAKIFFGIWAVTLVGGMIVSFQAFGGSSFPLVAEYIAGFWLLIVGIATILCGFFDRPVGPYAVSGIMQVAGAALCFFVPAFVDQQFVAAGVIGALSMLWLALYH